MPHGKIRGGHAAHRDAFITNPDVRGMGADLDLYAVAKDGQEIPIEVSLSPIKTSDGLLVSAAIRDVTERQHREDGTPATFRIVRAEVSRLGLGGRS